VIDPEWPYRVHVRGDTVTDLGPLDVVATIVAAVLERMPTMVDRLVTQIFAEEEVYARGLVSDEDLHRSFNDNMSHILRSLAGMTDAGEDLYRAPRATGTERADQRIPLESVLHTYRLGTQVMWEALLDEARSRPPEVLDNLVENAARLFQLVDRFSLAMVDSYRKRESDIRRLDADRREAIVDRLLEGHGAEPGVQAQAASLLGLPAHARYVVVVAAHDASKLGYRSPGEVLAAAGVHSAWRPRADRTVGVLRLGTISMGQALIHLKQTLSAGAGVSAEVTSLAELGIAHQLAELTFQTLGPGSTDVAVLDDKLPEALLVSSPQLATGLARGTLGRVLDLEAGERELLLQTLETWFRSERSNSRAAEQLYCHRNTVLNRLGRIEALTGGSLENDRHLLMCRLAIMAARLLPAAALASDG
jgi:hypothetical protein